MPPPANWLIFQSDNHARRFAGCYGHPAVRTPAIDRIGARGARFANAYTASPLCCPARAAIATGRFPHQTGFWDNATPYDGRVASWMHRLRDQGHRVDSIGKLHFRSSEDDNGWSHEIAPMHVLGGVGGLVGLLRWSDCEPARKAQWSLYAEESGAGDTKYQAYDEQIERLAIEWLRKRGRASGKPWCLYVSFVSPHPPFTVPQRLLDLYPPGSMPLPPAFGAAERPRHPALEHLRAKMGFREMDDADLLRRIAAAYCGLITFLDERIGAVLAAAEALGLLDRTHVLYTSDHGESAGAHGLFGKYTLLDPSAQVPLVWMGPGVAPGSACDRFVSHVDLFPTIVEEAGARLAQADADLPGASLRRALEAHAAPRPGFAEYHAAGSRSGAFMLIDGSLKLIYHVGMPAQLYDLASDPLETRDLAAERRAEVARLEALLRQRLDPEKVDRQAKEDQRRMAERHGGTEAILKRGEFAYTPPPGESTRLRPVP
jgi:choline-sulfatase